MITQRCKWILIRLLSAIVDIVVVVIVIIIATVVASGVIFVRELAIISVPALALLIILAGTTLLLPSAIHDGRNYGLGNLARDICNNEVRP